MKRLNNKLFLIILALLSLLVSFNCLFIGTLYYLIEEDAHKIRYSDSLEYSDINDGISLIKELPIQFNIQNEYFSGFDSLSTNIRESILMAYVLKNRINTYSCGNDLCIDKDKINDQQIKDKFNTSTILNSNTYKLYMDDYGNLNINSTSSSTSYRIVLNTNNHQFRKYTKFYKYKEESDLHLLYVYEGYYKGNCSDGEDIELHDFITGNVVYTDKCKNGTFEHEPPMEIDNLQLYKYELKKNDNNQFYLYGYNPVNK